MLEKTLEERVLDIEDLVADLPHILNLRFESITAAQVLAASRLDHLDKEMAMILREMRDLRGAVTRMLMAQDERIRAIEARLDSLEARFDKLEVRFDKLEVRFDKLEVRFDKLEARFDKLEARFDGLEARFDGLDARFDGFQSHVDTRFGSIDATLQEILRRLPAPH